MLQRIEPIHDALDRRLTAAEQTTISRWSLAVSVVFALIVLLLGVAAVTVAPGTGDGTRHAAAVQTCMPWDAAARDALAMLVREPSDAALSHVGDAVFRLRRARRNCEHGWVRLACQDYHAVMNVSSAGTPLPATSAVCWPAL